MARSSKLIILSIALLLPVLFSPNFANSLELAGQNFADTVKVGDKALTLNGLGLRTATIFKIKVYAAGLYLESKQQDADKIIASNENKKLEMKFIREVSRTKIRRAWIDGFESNNENLNPIRDRITQFSKSMTELKANDVLTLDFIGDKTTVLINNKQVADISGADFSQALLKIWLGKNPPNESLKNGLLGISQ